MKNKHKFTRREAVKTIAASGFASLGMANGIFNHQLFAQGLNLPPSVQNIESWNPIRRLNPVKPDDLIIRAAVGTTDVGNGVQDTAWLLNDSLPSPLIRVRKGEIFKVQLQNELPDQLILHWHDTLFAKTDTNNAGNFRRQDVAPYLGKTQYVLWSDVSQDMSNLIKWYNKEKKTVNPVELAARFHYSFEMIHPFIDGNGRIGRLLINFILYKNNYPMSNVEPKEKTSYINKLELSYVKNDNIIFVKWFVSKYLRDHKKFVK